MSMPVSGGVRGNGRILVSARRTTGREGRTSVGPINGCATSEEIRKKGDV